MTARVPLRQRDASGWRIPKQGTKSRRIYCMLKADLIPDHIHAIIGGSKQSLYVLIWKIKNPNDANGWNGSAATRKKKR